MLYIKFRICTSFKLKIKLFTLSGRLDPMGSPTGHGLIWTWSYLGSDQKRPEKISPSGHAQIRPARLIDIPTMTH